MKILNKYTNLIPYLYFIAIVLYWFINFSKNNTLLALLILPMAIPFIWQLAKPNKELNFTLGLIFICLSSYLILAYLSNLFDIPSMVLAKGIIIYSGLFVLLNFIMSAWIIKNSLNRTF